MTWASETALAFASASSDEVKGANALSLTIFEKRESSPTAFCTSFVSVAISSCSGTSNSAYPAADSYSTYRSPAIPRRRQSSTVKGVPPSPRENRWAIEG